MRKSFQYLLAANSLFLHLAHSELSESARKGSQFEALSSIYTHNCFYLAQAYGNIGDSKQSSKYCHLTLQRQYTFNLQPSFKDILSSSSPSTLTKEYGASIINKLKAAIDWVSGSSSSPSLLLSLTPPLSSPLDASLFLGEELRGDE